MIDGLSEDQNNLLQGAIDIVYSFGGDGTLLNLIRELCMSYKSS